LPCKTITCSPVYGSHYKKGSQKIYISSDSEWAAPTLIQAKKTGDVQILADFRRLNAQMNRKKIPPPKISDILRKLSGFTYATAIDLIMGYNHIPLDLKAQKICTTVLRRGTYQYKR
jgi:hypothetical protein